MPPATPADTLSIIIPCFNQEKWIERTVACALAQSRPPDELIVVDDGSTDGGVAKLARFGDAIRVIRQENAGASEARNRGLAEARGTVCMFLDGDDFVEGDAFGAATRALANADVAFSPCQTLRPDGSREQYFRFDPTPAPRQVYEKWLDYYSQPPCTVYWRTSFVRSIGGWDRRVSLNDDGELAMRAMLHEPRIASFDDGRGVYNAHSAPSISKSRSSKALIGEFDAMCRLVAAGQRIGWSTKGFQRKLYVNARAAFQIGDADHGRRALEMFRHIGGHGHIGSSMHVACASILGLEGKMKIAALMAGLHIRRGPIASFKNRRIDP